LHWPFFIAENPQGETAMPDDESTESQDTQESEEVEELQDDAILDLGDGEEEDTETEETKDEETDSEEEEEQQEQDEDDSELTTLKDENEDLKRQIKNLNKGAYQMRKALESKDKDKGDDEVEFTDAQLLGMLQEHKEDPAVVMQIMKYIGQQSARKAKDETLDAADIASTKKQVDAFVSKNWPELSEEGSDLRKDVDEAISSLRLKEHPYAEYLGISAALLANLPDMLKAAEEKGKSGALKDKTETNRKQSIKDKKLSDTGKKKTPESAKLSDTQEQTANQLGLTPDQKKLYSKWMKNKKQPVVAEV